MKIKSLIPKPRLVLSTPQATRSSLIQELKPRLVKLLLSNPAHPVPRGTEMNVVTPSHNMCNPLLHKEGEWPFTSFVENLMINLFSS
jgi:hypothetical protein